MRRIVVGLKRLVRPLVPDSLMARYRRAQHSRAVRSNVDIFVKDRRSAKRWLRLTPDTYRVIVGDPPRTSPDDVVSLGADEPQLARYLGWFDNEIVFAAYMDPPAMRGMRLIEPTVDAVSVAVRREVLIELAPPSEDPRTVLQHAKDAGLRVGVVQLPGRPRDTHLTSMPGPTVAILAAVPMHDIGGGSRAAQLAFELLRRSYNVVYVSRFPAAESVDLGLRYLHPRLRQTTFDVFDAEALAASTDSGVVLVEAPIREFLPPVETLAGAGWEVIYDIIDDWTDESLGGDWYARDVESELVAKATGVVASASDLVDHARTFGVEATLVPNGVNAAIFGATLDVDRPPDLPEGPVIGYHGSLYGDWFDWEALRAVADAYQDHAVVLIGDPDGIPHGLPGNVMALGLKAQGELPSYLAHTRVGLVPFELSDVTHAVSPLKVFEYLACGVPVAAPPMRALEGIDGVHTDDDLVAAVGAAMDAPRPNRNAALAEHGWGRRVGTLLATVGWDLQPEGRSDLRIVRRATVHYGRGERYLTP